jgi:NADPH2 dehydrogenase
MSSTPKLFQEIKVGDMVLKHRVVMAPLTRYRADVNHVPLDIVKKYYEQRASCPGKFLSR